MLKYFFFFNKCSQTGITRESVFISNQVNYNNIEIDVTNTLFKVVRAGASNSTFAYVCAGKN